MPKTLRYRGRAVSAADVRFINELIAKHPADMRSVGLATAQWSPAGHGISRVDVGAVASWIDSAACSKTATAEPTDHTGTPSCAAGGLHTDQGEFAGAGATELWSVMSPELTAETAQHMLAQTPAWRKAAVVTLELLARAVFVRLPGAVPLGASRNRARRAH
jgi:hypothetical protein